MPSPVIRASVTLEKAAELARRRAAGEAVYSLSTPTFDERGPELASVRWSSALSPAAGLPALRDIARTRLFARWRLPDHECWIAAGSKAAIHAVLRRLARPGAGVVIISPHWPSYDDLCRLCFLEPLHHGTFVEEAFDIDESRLERFLVESAVPPVAILFSNPGNPTGKIYPPGQIEAVVRLAARHGVAVILDESFSGTVRDPRNWVPAPEPADGGGQLYVINSFSKNYHLQGLRVAACLCPRAVLHEVVDIHQAVNSAASVLAQDAVVALVGRLPEHQPYGRLDRQWELTRRFMEGQDWTYVEPEGSFHCFPRLGDVEAFKRRADAAGIILLCGDAFGRHYGNHVRLCFAKPVEDLERIYRRLTP